MTAERLDKPLSAGSITTSPGKRRLREVGTDGSHDGEWAVSVGDVILDDDGGPSLLDFVADRGVEANQVDLAATQGSWLESLSPRDQPDRSLDLRPAHGVHA